MNRKEYFLLALKNNKHMEVSWLFSAFSITANVDEKNLKHLDLVQTPAGISFYNKETDSMVNINPEQVTPGQPLLNFKRGIRLKAGDLPNVHTDIETTYGNCIFNMCSLVYGFGSKFPFVTGLVSIKKIEAKIAEVLQDTPKDGNRDPKAFYCDEYIKYSDGIQFLTELSNMAVWGVTEKALTPPPGIKELKKKLLEENKDKLHDPVVIANIYDQLIKHDSEYLKGDASEDFLISDKLRKVVRRKLYLMQGAEPGLGNRNELDLVTNSLYEGWQNDKFATFNNVSRAGSFDRGSETQLGGVSAKEILRATSNTRIVKGDCGTKMGIQIIVTDDNYRSLVGLRLIEDNGTKQVQNESDAKSYLGKVINKRSPMFCKLEKTDFCEYCVGKRLADTETGASMAATELGGIFLGIFMSSMHAKELRVSEMDLNTCFT